MKQMMKKISAVLLALTFGIIVTGNIAVASDGSPVYAALMEINDDNLISIAEELKTTLHIKQQHLDLYSASPEIIELSQKADELFAGECTQVHILTVEFDDILSLFLPSDEIKEYHIDEEILSMIDYRIGNALISSLNSQVGVNNIALSSILTGSRSFVADLDHEILVVLEYDGEFSLVADFFSSGEHVMTAVETIIPSVMVADLLTACKDPHPF